jgi:predicted acetyltransferase
MHVQEFIHETTEALSQLCTFLHSQADQVRTIVVNTHDQDFHHLLFDPRNGSDRLIPTVYHETNAQGVGLMYRVVDVPGIFQRLAGHNFGGETCSLRLTVDDSFLPENGGSTRLSFEAGTVHLADQGAPDVEIRLDIADFSSLLVGTATFRSLYRYGRAEISSNDYVDIVHRLFAVDEPPRCTTDF